MIDLTENEKLALQIFTSEAGAFPTVYKIVKDKIERSKSAYITNLKIKKDFSNEEIGAKIRAFDEGADLVDAIFREISQYQKQNIEPKINRAR